MKRIKIPVAAIISSALIFAFFTIGGCEKKQQPQQQEQTQQTAATPSSSVTAPVETPTATSEPLAQTNPDALKGVVFKVYENEDQPDKFVELSEFKTACPEAVGNIFGTGILTVNPSLPDEKKIPVERVVSVFFDKRGLVEPTIKGVGKITQPVGYRDCKITLKDPDETLTGIVVLCRQLEGKQADGTAWSLELQKDVAIKFYKIDLVR